MNIYDEICLHTQPSQTHPCPYHMFHLFHGPEITMKQVFQENFSPILELYKKFNMGLTPPRFLNKIKRCVFSYWRASITIDCIEVFIDDAEGTSTSARSTGGRSAGRFGRTSAMGGEGGGGEVRRRNKRG